jgi:hypothetical protein
MPCNLLYTGCLTRKLPLKKLPFPELCSYLQGLCTLYGSLSARIERVRFIHSILMSDKCVFHSRGEINLFSRLQFAAIESRASRFTMQTQCMVLSQSVNSQLHMFDGTFVPRGTAVLPLCTCNFLSSVSCDL